MATLTQPVINNFSHGIGFFSVETIYLYDGAVAVAIMETKVGPTSILIRMRFVSESKL